MLLILGLILLRMRSISDYKLRRRAQAILCSLLDSGYKIIVSSEYFGYYRLSHANGSIIVIQLVDGLVRTTKNGREIKL